MSKIVIGQATGKDVRVDLDVLLRTRLLIQANSGKGKSWLLRRIAEQLFGKVQVVSDLMDFWMSSPTLGHAEREILRVLSESGAALTKQEIAERTTSNKGTPYEPEGGAFNNPLGKLRTLGLIEGYGQIKLCEELLEAVGA